MVTFYICFIKNYVTFKEMLKRNNSALNSVWKTAGIAAAWFITAISIAKVMYVSISPSKIHIDRPILITFIFFGKVSEHHVLV